MTWLFWGLLAGSVGGLFLLAILARRKRHPLRPARPSTTHLLRALGWSMLGVLWVLSHPFGHAYGRRRRYNFDPSRYDFDPSKDYVREHQRQLEERRNRTDQQ